MSRYLAGLDVGVAAGDRRLSWRRSSAWSVRAVEGPWAVSRSLSLDREQFSAWRGEALDPARRDIPMPVLLGVFADAAQARACCEADARADARADP